MYFLLGWRRTIHLYIGMEMNSAPVCYCKGKCLVGPNASCEISLFLLFFFFCLLWDGLFTYFSYKSLNTLLCSSHNSYSPYLYTVNILRQFTFYCEISLCLVLLLPISSAVKQILLCSYYSPHSIWPWLQVCCLGINYAVQYRCVALESASTFHPKWLKTFELRTYLVA